MKYRRITKREAQKRFAANQLVLVCPRKMRPDGPFSMASIVFGGEYRERALRLYNNADPKFAWDLMYNNWKHYNASHETGYYAHYYVQEG